VWVGSVIAGALCITGLVLVPAAIAVPVAWFCGVANDDGGEAAVGFRECSGGVAGEIDICVAGACGGGLAAASAADKHVSGDREGLVEGGDRFGEVGEFRDN
jgi:hypothetical protein